MASGTFPGSFWRRLLKLVDAELEAEASMVIIGGAAIALEYANRHLTRDLDTSTSIQGALLDAVERARKAIQAEDDLDEAPPVGAAGVFDAPEGYEERCRLVRIAGLRRLRVHVPERHDLALMKAARGDERDRVTRGPAVEVPAARGAALRRERGEADRAEPQGAHVDGGGAWRGSSATLEEGARTPKLRRCSRDYTIGQNLAWLVKNWSEIPGATEAKREEAVGWCIPATAIGGDLGWPIVCPGASAEDSSSALRVIAARRPLPHVPRQVLYPLRTVPRGMTPYGAGSGETLRDQIISAPAPAELVPRRVVTPRVLCRPVRTARRPFPFLFCRKPLPGPFAVRDRLPVVYAIDRMAGTVFAIAVAVRRKFGEHGFGAVRQVNRVPPLPCSRLP